MKEFLKILRRFVPPYKKYLFLNIFFNILAAFLTLFSFALIILILEMLFMGDKGVVYHYMDWTSGSFKDVAINNYYSAYYCKIHLGPSVTLMLLAVALVVMTAFKTGATYLSLYFPDPDSFGNRARHPQFCLRQDSGPSYRLLPRASARATWMARMSGDVAEVENSIMASSLDMMFKNPIMIVVCLGMMIVISVGS